MAEIYILNVSECEEELLKLLPKISKERISKIEKLYNAQARLLSIASEVILAFSLSESLPITYKTDKNGKPFIPTLPFFNITHSGILVGCAVSNKQVGLDIEKISRMKMDIARKILSPEEYSATQYISGARLQALLCEKWVRKESYLKMTGEGLRRSMTSLNFSGDTLEGTAVFCRTFPICDGYLLSFCREEEVPLNLRFVSKADLKEYFSLT